MTLESIIRDRAAELNVSAADMEACLAAVRALDTGEGDLQAHKRTILRLLPGAWERLVGLSMQREAHRLLTKGNPERG